MSATTAENKDLYFVAVKIFLEDKDGRLLITKDRFGDWDLPGGRLREKDTKHKISNKYASRR